MYSLAMISAESLFIFAFDNACINSVFIILYNQNANIATIHNKIIFKISKCSCVIL